MPPSGIVTVQEYGSSSRRRPRSGSAKITGLLFPALELGMLVQHAMGRRTIWLGVGVASLSMGCGASHPTADVASGGRVDAGAVSVVDAGSQAPVAERPFAGTAVEAQRMIQEQIEGRMK